MTIRKVLRFTANVLGLLAGVGATLFVRGVLYRFSIPASTKLQQIGMWAFGVGVSLAVQQKINAVFLGEAEGVANQIEGTILDPLRSN